MAATVSDVLATRLHAGEPPKGLSTVLSVLFHGSFLALLALVSRTKPVTFVQNVATIRIISPAALGRTSTAPVAAPAPSAPKAKPVIEKVKPAEVKPTEKAMPLPKNPKEKAPPTPPKPAAAQAARAAAPSAGPAIDLPSAGRPDGEATGASLLGAAVAGLDADFPYAYYVEQMQVLIGGNWIKPVNVPDGTACVISFRILKTGQITEIKVETPSALPFYDRSALSAVQKTNPLPPLPPEFKSEYLGVHLKFL